MFDFRVVARARAADLGAGVLRVAVGSTPPVRGAVPRRWRPAVSNGPRPGVIAHYGGDIAQANRAVGGQ